MCPSAVNIQSPPSQSSIIGSGAVFTRNRLNYLFMYYAVCRRRWLWLHNNWRQSGTTPLLCVHRYRRWWVVGVFWRSLWNMHQFSGLPAERKTLSLSTRKSTYSLYVFTKLLNICTSKKTESHLPEPIIWARFHTHTPNSGTHTHTQMKTHNAYAVVIQACTMDGNFARKVENRRQTTSD